jgi:hypothetical protein
VAPLAGNGFGIAAGLRVRRANTDRKNKNQIELQ